MAGPEELAGIPGQQRINIERKGNVNEDILQGKWKQFRGKVKEEWGELTDDELDQIEGRRDQLVGLLQEKYGYSKARAEREYDNFLDELDDDNR